MTIKYLTVAFIGPNLFREQICRSMAEMRELVGDAALASALYGSPTEVWVLAHDHEYTDDETCECELYLTEPSPYCTFHREEAPA